MATSNAFRMCKRNVLMELNELKSMVIEMNDRYYDFNFAEDPRPLDFIAEYRGMLEVINVKLAFQLKAMRAVRTDPIKTIAKVIRNVMDNDWAIADLDSIMEDDHERLNQHYNHLKRTLNSLTNIVENL